MLVQIYEVTSAEEASALTKLGVDHIGVLVGKGEFPREQSIEAAKRIFCRHTAVVQGICAVPFGRPERDRAGCGEPSAGNSASRGVI